MWKFLLSVDAAHSSLVSNKWLSPWLPQPLRFCPPSDATFEHIRSFKTRFINVQSLLIYLVAVVAFINQELVLAHIESNIFGSYA
jgi:hypothetical protein